MKTLDEVISALEICWEQGTCSKECPYMMAEPSCGLRRELDALHYLKEYKRVQKKIEKIAIGNIEDVLDKIDNPPLTWDELKLMEGKPVWIETDNLKFWTIVDNFRAICNQECLCCSKGYMCRSTHARGDWKAYRKERK